MSYLLPLRKQSLKISKGQSEAVNEGQIIQRSTTNYYTEN